MIITWKQFTKKDSEREKREHDLLSFNSNRNQMIRENSLLKREHFEKDQYLKGLQAKEQKYVNTIAGMKSTVKSVVEEKRKG